MEIRKKKRSEERRMKFSERLKLSKGFEEWCKANKIDFTPFSLITYLDLLELLKNKKQIECINCVKWNRETGRCFYGDWVKEPDDYCSWAEEKKG